ncbi:hypothetical protein CLF_105469 [Clonorchis sinensis]|uniref:Uncharacterized protein n=1 Tax=Clonorchis sinensis TaxID=79923 RepID=G7YPC3_CLOSI|nr:hypothetical protein CLF_105469 [Clonorchis sinensis]
MLYKDRKLIVRKLGNLMIAFQMMKVIEAPTLFCVTNGCTSNAAGDLQGQRKVEESEEASKLSVFANKLNSTRSTGCPVRLCLRRQRNHLAVTSYFLEHNHKLSKFLYDRLPVNRRLTEDDLGTYRALLKYGTPSCEVRQFVADEFGKILTTQDIWNYRRKYKQCIFLITDGMVMCAFVEKEQFAPMRKMFDLLKEKLGGHYPGRTFVVDKSAAAAQITRKWAVHAQSGIAYFGNVTNNRLKNVNGRLKDRAGDSKREEFRKYLEKAGVLDALTKGKVAANDCSFDTTKAKFYDALNAPLPQAKSSDVVEATAEGSIDVADAPLIQTVFPGQSIAYCLLVSLIYGAAFAYSVQGEQSNKMMGKVCGTIWEWFKLLCRGQYNKHCGDKNTLQPNGKPYRKLWRSLPSGNRVLRDGKRSSCVWKIHLSVPPKHARFWREHQTSNAKSTPFGFQDGSLPLDNSAGYTPQVALIWPRNSYARGPFASQTPLGQALSDGDDSEAVIL